MSQSVSQYLRNFSALPFVVQFVLTAEVEETGDSATMIKTYLIPANSQAEAHAAAMEMMESLSDRYKNREGEVVSVRCEGIHSVEELDYVDSEGRLDMATFLFAGATQSSDLIGNGVRRDLPLLQ